MSETTPPVTPPAAAEPPKPAEASAQKKQTVRISLPPKPAGGPSIRVPAAAAPAAPAPAAVAAPAAPVAAPSPSESRSAMAWLTRRQPWNVVRFQEASQSNSAGSPFALKVTLRSSPRQGAITLCTVRFQMSL